jgi:signal transduction protein with GAF and PtsI domain
MVDEHGGVLAAPGSMYAEEDLSPEHRKIMDEFNKRVSREINRMKGQCEAVNMPGNLQSGLMLTVLMNHAGLVACLSGVSRQSFLDGCRIHYDLAFEEVTENEPGQVP